MLLLEGSFHPKATYLVATKLLSILENFILDGCVKKCIFAC